MNKTRETSRLIAIIKMAGENATILTKAAYADKYSPIPTAQIQAKVITKLRLKALMAIPVHCFKVHPLGEIDKRRLKRYNRKIKYNTRELK